MGYPGDANSLYTTLARGIPGAMDLSDGGPTELSFDDLLQRTQPFMEAAVQRSLKHNKDMDTTVQCLLSPSRSTFMTPRKEETANQIAMKNKFSGLSGPDMGIKLANDEFTRHQQLNRQRRLGVMDPSGFRSGPTVAGVTKRELEVRAQERAEEFAQAQSSAKSQGFQDAFKATHEKVEREHQERASFFVEGQEYPARSAK